MKKVGSVDYYPSGDPRLGEPYTDSEFYEVRDEGNNVVARVIREREFPCHWLVYNIYGRIIDSHESHNNLFHKMEKLINGDLSLKINNPGEDIITRIPNSDV